MKKVLSVLQKVENWIIVITFTLMVAACFVQVVNRNIFKIPVSGLEEVSRYSMIFMVLLGTELGMRDGTQISVNGLVDMFKGKIRKTIQIISKTIVVGFSGFLFVEVVGMVRDQFVSGQTSPGLQLPMWAPYMTLAISFGLITIIQGYTLIKMIGAFNTPDVPDALENNDTKGGVQS